MKITISFSASVVLTFVLLTATVNAAVMSFYHQIDVVQAGDVITVAVVLDTAGEPVNAVEVQIQYGTSELALVDIQDGDSVINFWVQEPAVFDEGKILLSGITPGGISGRDLNIITLKFEAKKEGIGSALLQQVQVLLHDGLGTPLETTLIPLSFNILGQSTLPAVTAQYIDTEAPEPFTPIVSSDPDIFEGRLFLVFATEDKGSGIDFFEVKEGRLADYERATSPYEIKDQTLQKEIWVRAVDNAGNEYVATIYPQNYEPWYQTMQIKTVILVVCLGIVLFLSRRFLFKRS